MSSFIDVDRIKIRKVWSEGDEIIEQEGTIENENDIDEVIKTLDMALPYDDFYPSKLGVPSYLLTFYDEDEETELSLEGDLIIFENGSEAALPIGKLTMVKLLEGFLTEIKTTMGRIKFEDAYRRVANG